MAKKMFKILKPLLVSIVSMFTVILLTVGITNASVMRKPINYRQSSETTTYPDVNKTPNENVLVKLNKNRVYIRSGQKVVYTMYCSGGMKDPAEGKYMTPTGHFSIQSEHGNSFYNSQLKEGANYWTSFKNHGEYLFHTVPTDAQGNYKPAEAAKLGEEPGSHGCIRLSIPDAKYIQTLPVGTQVTIRN